MSRCRRCMGRRRMRTGLIEGGRTGRERGYRGGLWDRRCDALIEGPHTIDGLNVRYARGDGGLRLAPPEVDQLFRPVTLGGIEACEVSAPAHRASAVVPTGPLAGVPAGGGPLFAQRTDLAAVHV